VLIDEPHRRTGSVIAERIEETLQDLRGKMTILLVDRDLKSADERLDHLIT
jgi:ABC-type branched-subunit amino acid transport system ATPase component